MRTRNGAFDPKATSREFALASINNAVGTLIYSRGPIELNLGLVDIPKRELTVAEKATQTPLNSERMKSA